LILAVVVVMFVHLLLPGFSLTLEYDRRRMLTRVSLVSRATALALPVREFREVLAERAILREEVLAR